MMATSAHGKSRIFGRDRELAFAEQFLNSSRERPAVVIFEGEPGIGKTTLWREVVGRAEQRGFRVLSCRPAEIEMKLPLSAIADLLETVADDVFAALPDPQRRALEIALLRVEPMGVRLEPRTLAAAFRSLIWELGRRGPLLLAVDDIQWLDRSSARLIQFAVRRLEQEPIVWLFVRRSGEPAPLAPEELVAPESLSRVSIKPLTVAAMHRMLDDRIEHPPNRPALTRIHRVSAGNPLFALEIARDLLTAGTASAPATISVPEDLRTLILRRVRRLPEATRDALLAAAALSEPSTSILDEQALAAAEEADLARIDAEGRVTFRHPLYASAVYESASRTRRRQLHGRLAELVEDPEERARHMALAVAEPDATVATALEDAAALARARGAWESAGQLLEQAARLTPPAQSDESHRRRVAAAEHHVHAGDRRRARALLEETLEDGIPRPLRAEALRLLAEICYNDESFVEARRLFFEALEFADDGALAAAIERGLGYVHAMLWDFSAAAAHAGRALERAEAIGETTLLSNALASGAITAFFSGSPVDWEKVERSLALEDPETIGALQQRPSMIAALLTLFVGRHAEARNRLTAVSATAREQGDESDLAFVLLWLSWLEATSGNVAASANLVEEAGSIAALTGSASMRGWALAQRALVRSLQGEVEGTRAYCIEGASLIDDLGPPANWIATSLALLELSLGNPTAAWNACESLTEFVEQRGLAQPIHAFFSFLPEAMDALIGLDRLDRAEAILGVFEGRAREFDRSWALAAAGRCRGTLLAARGDLDGAADVLERAVAEHERSEMPFDRARTLLAKGIVERRARHRTRAKASLEEARDSFERLGSPLWAKRAAAELSRIGLRRSKSEELTPTESRVAELVAQGLTNREVAAALFISPKTVEANLARVYRKLGIGSRAELGGRMSGRDPT